MDSYEVYAPEVYHCDDTRITINKLKQSILNYNPDILVASSLGAFFTVCCQLNYKTILINPALNASKDIYQNFFGKDIVFSCKRENGITHSIINQPFIATLEENEKCYLENKSKKNQGVVYGIFGKNDEYFSHSKEYSNLFGENYIFVDDSHHVGEETIKKYVIPKIIELTNKVG